MPIRASCLNHKTAGTRATDNGGRDFLQLGNRSLAKDLFVAFV